MSTAIVPSTIIIPAVIIPAISRGTRAICRSSPHGGPARLLTAIRWGTRILATTIVSRHHLRNGGMTGVECSHSNNKFFTNMMCLSLRRVMHVLFSVILIYQSANCTLTTTITTTLAGEEAPPLSWPNLDIAIHKNGFYGITADGQLKDVSMAGEVRDVEGMEGRVRQVQCSADGTILAVGTSKGVLVKSMKGIQSPQAPSPSPKCNSVQ